MDPGTQRLRIIRSPLRRRYQTFVVRGIYLVILLLLFVLARGSTSSADSSPTPRERHEYRVLEIDGVINPLSASYLIREIEAATRDSAAGLILKLDTPGGLESSMREMTQAILSSPVPVIAYVSPAGARAASAGMFLVLSAHVAAMAPDTTIGAAHPVRLGGGGPAQPQGNDTEHMEEKIVNDAASFARALAQRWGRNATWVEEAVRRSVSITADEALEAKVIDVVAENVEQLLTAINGREVRVQDQRAVRITSPSSPDAYVERPMTFAEKILHTITDPNIAYLLMSAGILGITIELYSPGLLFPGVTGVIALLLAFISLGSLPISWAGLTLIGVALIMFVLELLVQGFGMLGIGGIFAFILGSLFLYRPVGPVSPALPEVQVSPWLIATSATALGLIVFGVMRAVIRSQRSAVTSGPQALVGARGVTESILEPDGLVRVDSEQWSARIDPLSEQSHLDIGDVVEVTDVRGVTLFVKRTDAELPHHPILREAP